MTRWLVVCPNCSTENEIPPEIVTISCGQVFCDCTCTNCGTSFLAEQDYALWLGLPGPLPPELTVEAE